MWKAAAKIDQWHAGASQLIAAHCEISRELGCGLKIAAGPIGCHAGNMAACAAATTNKNSPRIGNRALPENQPRSGNEVTLAIISGQIPTIQKCS